MGLFVLQVLFLTAGDVQTSEIRGKTCNDKSMSFDSPICPKGFHIVLKFGFDFSALVAAVWALPDMNRNHFFFGCAVG